MEYRPRPHNRKNLPNDEAWLLLFIAASMFILAITIFLVTRSPLPQ